MLVRRSRIFWFFMCVWRATWAMLRKVNPISLPHLLTVQPSISSLSIPSLMQIRCHRTALSDTRSRQTLKSNLVGVVLFDAMHVLAGFPAESHHSLLAYLGHESLLAAPHQITLFIGCGLIQWFIAPFSTASWTTMTKSPTPFLTRFIA